MDSIDILIHVLAHVELFTLLRCQLVCRTWADLIRSTNACQKALFFRANGSKASGPKSNPILARTFPTFFKHISPKPGSYWSPWNDASFEGSPGLQALLRSEASWRHMYTHQPPITRLEAVTFVEREDDGDDEVYEAFLDLEREPKRGLQMGELYDLALELMGEFVHPRVPRLHVAFGPLIPDEKMEGVSNCTSYLRLYLTAGLNCRFDAEDFQRFNNAVRAAKSEAHAPRRLKFKKMTGGAGLQFQLSSAGWTVADRS